MGHLVGQDATDEVRRQLSPREERVASPRVEAASLTGGRVELQAPSSLDIDFLYELAVASGFRWRFRGHVPTRDMFAQTMWHDVLAQFVVMSLADCRRAGLVVLHNADLRSGHAAISQLIAPEFERTGLALEAAGLFLAYVFDNWNFRKLYGEIPEFNYEPISRGAGRLFRVEARLPAHHYYAGRYWDHLILALYREDWAELRGRFGENVSNEKARRRSARLADLTR